MARLGLRRALDRLSSTGQHGNSQLHWTGTALFVHNSSFYYCSGEIPYYPKANSSPETDVIKSMRTLEQEDNYISLKTNHISSDEVGLMRLFCPAVSINEPEWSSGMIRRSGPSPELGEVPRSSRGSGHFLFSEFFFYPNFVHFLLIRSDLVGFFRFGMSYVCNSFFLTFVGAYHRVYLWSHYGITHDKHM